MSTDFMASCRHSAPRIILIPKDRCHPAAPAVWRLPLRTAWSPRPWVKLVLMFSTEPSQHTQASQCTICLHLPQASLVNLFAVALKIPRSCSSALWTAVPASCPLCIPKAESSQASPAHLGPLSDSSPLTFILSQAVGRTSTKSVEPVGSLGLWKAGLDGQTWLFRNACISSIFPQFAGPGDQQEFLFKGNLESHFKDACYFHLSKDTNDYA